MDVRCVCVCATWVCSVQYGLAGSYLMCRCAVWASWVEPLYVYAVQIGLARTVYTVYGRILAISLP
jgi:hypothetical protein